MTQYKALVGLDASIQDDVAALLPRQAAVARPDGNTVWVRFVGEPPGAPPTQLPTTVAGVPAGTTGWVYPVAGGKGLFVVSDAPVVIPFRANQVPGAAMSTTLVSGGLVYAAEASVRLFRGRWELTGIASGLLWRSVNGGARIHGVEVDGNSPTPFHDLDLPLTRMTPVARSLSVLSSVSVEEERDVTIRYGFRGASSAGTTSCSNATIYGTARRIGGLT